MTRTERYARRSATDQWELSPLDEEVAAMTGKRRRADGEMLHSPRELGRRPIRSYHGVSAAHPEKLPKLTLRMRDIYDIALFVANDIVTISFGRPGGKKIQGGFSRWYDGPELDRK